VTGNARGKGGHQGVLEKNRKERGKVSRTVQAPHEDHFPTKMERCTIKKLFSIEGPIRGGRNKQYPAS